MRMTEISVADAEGVVLDWLVAHAHDFQWSEVESADWTPEHWMFPTPYSRSWAAGGPLIDKSLAPIKAPPEGDSDFEAWVDGVLVAAMRATVFARFGNHVHVPTAMLETLDSRVDA